MEKQSKNLLTRNLIEKELRFYNTADIRSVLVLYGGMSLLFVPLTIGIVYEIFILFKAVWLKIILSALVIGLANVPLLWLKKSLTERKLLQNGDFDIAVCKVQYKDERIVFRHTEKFLHFVGFKAVSVTNVNYDLTAQGDEFYIIHYKGRTDIKLVYSLKMYMFKEK